MDLSLLAIGDVHLGRRPSRIPADLAGEYDVRVADLSPAAAWRRAVDTALERDVDAVVLTGDVVESDNHWFEAYYHLEAGVRRLVDAGIGVYAVAGNHDVEALPRLSREIEGFRLIGRGGEWESVRHADAFELLGWSFPERVVQHSPLREPPPAPASQLPRVGLLHADLDARTSRYAPVSRSELDRVDVDAWLLGHIHAPSLGNDARPVGYLGSLSPLDPTERGRRGPWLLSWSDGRLDCEHLALAPLRWEQLDVDVSSWTSAHDLEGALARELLALAERLAPELGGVRALGCAVRLTGRTVLSRELREFVDTLHNHLRREVGGTLVFVERVTPAWKLDCDLQSLARGRDAPGLLARRLLSLRGEGAEPELGAELVAGARETLRRLADERSWLDLRPAELDENELRAALESAAEEALEELLAQAEARP